MIDTSAIRIYQPIPFEGYKNLTPTRYDCDKRYNRIREFIQPARKTLIDLCCSNGYFGFRFLQDGGAEFVGVENNRNEVDFINKLAEEEKLNAKCHFTINNVVGKFDYGFYLDTHYHNRTELYIDFITQKVNELYASCCVGAKNNEFCEQLSSYYKSVVDIYRGYENRIIFQCKDLKDLKS